MENAELYAHLRDLCLITKRMHPHRYVIERYSEETKASQLGRKQRELLPQLVKALALLNRHGREEDRFGHIHACREDLVNALALLERTFPEKSRAGLLSAPERRFLVKLEHSFGYDRFTGREARMATGLAKTTVNWKLHELASKGLVHRVGGCKNKGYIYQLQEGI